MNGEDWEDWSEEEIEMHMAAAESHYRALSEIQGMLRQREYCDNVMAMRSGVKYWALMNRHEVFCVSQTLEALREVHPYIIEFGDWPMLSTQTKRPPEFDLFLAPCSKLFAKTGAKKPRRFKQVLYSNLFPRQQREDSWPVWLDGFVCTREELWKLKKLLKTRKIEEITPF